MKTYRQQLEEDIRFAEAELRKYRQVSTTLGAVASRTAEIMVGHYETELIRLKARLAEAQKERTV